MSYLFDYRNKDKQSNEDCLTTVLSKFLGTLVYFIRTPSFFKRGIILKAPSFTVPFLKV